MVYDLIARETYYIGASCWNSRIGDYMLRVIAPEEEIQRNTSFENALDIHIGDLVSVEVTASNQIRYYRFTPTVGGNYTFESYNRTGNTDPCGYLYNANRTQLAYNDDGAGNLNFTVIYNLVAGETYYMGASCWGSRIGSYMLRVIPPAQDESDNTSFEQALTITAGAVTPVTVTAANQIRYYKFIPTVSGTYIFESFGRSATADPYGYLYNANRTQIAFNDDGAGSLNFRIAYNLTAGETYYIGATCWSLWIGSYSLRVIAP